MKYFNRHYFTDDQGESLEHRAKYGTANSVSEEKGTDNKKNNTSEYNHKYYEENKEKWQKSNNDDLYYDKDGNARFGHKNFDPNDPDFQRKDGEQIPGTDLKVFTNANGSLIVLGDGIKFSYPPGTKLTSEMKNAIADVEKSKGDLNDEQYVAKMHNVVTGFADKQGLDTDKAGVKEEKPKKSSKKSSSKKESDDNDEKEESTKSSSKKIRTFDEANEDYKKTKKLTKKTAADLNRSANERGKKTTEYYKKHKSRNYTYKSSAKHSDDLGSVLVSSLF